MAKKSKKKRAPNYYPKVHDDGEAIIRQDLTGYGYRFIVHSKQRREPSVSVVREEPYAGRRSIKWFVYSPGRGGMTATEALHLSIALNVASVLADCKGELLDPKKIKPKDGIDW